MVVCPLNSLEEKPDISDLPRIGVVGKIKNVIELPNGNKRIITLIPYGKKYEEVCEAILWEFYI